MIGSSIWARNILAAVGIFGLGFLTIPLVIIVPMSFSSATALTFPPPGLSLRWYDAFFGDGRWMDAMRTSIVLALISSIAALTLGGLAAYGLRRRAVAGASLAEGNFMVPLFVPTIITAVALYLGLAKMGLLGSFLGLVVAHTILNVPICVMVLGVAIREFDPRLEQVAWSLGASWLLTIRRVVLPSLAPSVFAAWIFAFIGSFDEVIVTSFIAGAYETVPKVMFNKLILEVDPTITAVATLLIAFTVLALAIVAVVRAQSDKLKSSVIMQ
ncbi:ABC transporter permease [Bradyrhizobium mercantei]|uniref:ABC transporter permease n=1 Tax=Bradyrhizobium mercantei TaxID=1904807 RepID=UPI00097698AD|nr:ABC transporter permease [Bradyrhizobium mercantei]